MLLILQALHDVIVEAVFPACGIFQSMDVLNTVRETVLSQLSSGELYSILNAGSLLSGSSAEGLRMEFDCGHPNADLDTMALFGGWFGVSLPQSYDQGSPHLSGTNFALAPHGIKANSCLEYESKDCPPAYTRIRVTDIQTFVEITNANCLEEFDGQHWVHIPNLAKTLSEMMNIGLKVSDPLYEITGNSGPAAQAGGELFEYIITLVMNGPHPCIDQYLKRSHCMEWPSKEQLYAIKQLPMCLVLATHKDSPIRHLLARCSWSTAELILIVNLPKFVKQGYIAAKFTLKSLLKDTKKVDDGRSNVCSYHLKTTFLHYLEKNPPSNISSPFGLMIDLLKELENYLNKGVLPNYFLSDCNILETVGPDQKQIAIQAIHTILSNPIKTLINCPSTAIDIFNDISTDDLIKAFSCISIHPYCEGSREHFRKLISRLDEWRKEWYRRQLLKDEYNGKSGRAEMIVLMDMLYKNKIL